MKYEVYILGSVKYSASNLKSELLGFIIETKYSLLIRAALI